MHLPGLDQLFDSVLVALGPVLHLARRDHLHGSILTEECDRP
jgi:hypothetical protein